MKNKTPHTIYDLLRHRTYGTLYLGNRIARGKEPACRRDLSIAFADIVDYTKRSVSWDGKKLITFLEHFYEMVTKAAQKTDGYVDKFMGDGVMVLHGLKLRRDQDVRLHPAQSVLCAMNVLQELANYNRERPVAEQMHVRIGIASGEITAGTFRNENRLIFTALGVRANMAARLQKMAEPDTILISDELQSRLERENSLRYQSISCGVFELRGFNRPIKGCMLKLPGLTAGGSQSY